MTTRTIRTAVNATTAPVDARDGPPRCEVLGVGVSAIDPRRALVTIDRWIARRQRTYVCVTGVHGVMESQRDPELKRIHNRAGMVTPDGMPLVWISRLRGFRNVSRVYGPDLMLAVCGESVGRGYRHFFYGGDAGVADALARRLRERFPGLRTVGTFCPPFGDPAPADDQRAVDAINAADPDIVWVGLGTPRQERWMARHLGRLSAPVLIGVGAAFDFHAGRKRQAPRWMQRSGLEWVFRLLSEPRRLWRRYLRNNPRFAFLLLSQWLRERPASRERARP